ncbi:MAG: TonB family protein [Candidatus Eiseniibacteriota bacterium]
MTTSDLMPRMGMTLPLVGEDHPLRKAFRRTFVWSAVLAMLVHGLAAGGRIVVQEFLLKESELPPAVNIVSIENFIPPSISEEAAPPQVSLAEQVSQPSIGDPVPVPDYDAQELTVATVEEMSEMQTSDLSALTGGGDSLVVSFGDGVGSGQGNYQVYEEAPALISIPKPEYPSIARSAEVEGVVVLLVLVGEDGSVEEVRVSEGPDLLHEAAIAAAKQARFRPALTQQRPVAAWVRLPLKFTLSS